MYQKCLVCIKSQKMNKGVDFDYPTLTLLLQPYITNVKLVLALVMAVYNHFLK